MQRHQIAVLAMQRHSARSLLLVMLLGIATKVIVVTEIAVAIVLMQIVVTTAYLVHVTKAVQMHHVATVIQTVINLKDLAHQDQIVNLVALVT
jgi:hypothetical protein